DFDIDRETVYYSNTYDEIFKAKGNAVEDTIKIGSPDKIEVDGDRLFITTRKAEEGYFYLISADKITGDVFSRTALNDSHVTGGVFSTASITGSSKGLWLINTFKSRLELYGNELQLIEFFDLDRSYNYGNFRIGADNARIICSKDGSIFISSVDLKSGDQRFSDRKCDSGTLDISVSAVTDNGIFIYDYRNGIIRIF
ncbi:MAG: hypothetical protein JXN63_06720, partial [Candidatus Delongbacteria bacterium]|nr:hypothetical protein [Candidatus Delongbacteria bacterium]